MTSSAKNTSFIILREVIFQNVNFPLYLPIPKSMSFLRRKDMWRVVVKETVVRKPLQTCAAIQWRVWSSQFALDPRRNLPKLSYSLRRLVPNSGKYIVLADDDRHEEVTDRQLLIVIIFIAVVWGSSLCPFPADTSYFLGI